jgi:peptidoglycan-associated lipoprotein|tara:strand:- start:540 stop:1058 length:519 start_codon:yes stop_codon:yes gene_type:complete
MEELQLKKSLLLLSLLATLGAGCSSTPLDAPADPSASNSNYYGVDAATAEALGLEELRGNQLLSQRSVFFDFNKYDIKPEFQDLIGAHAQYLNNHEPARMIIKGNADYRGSHEYNLSLGQKRSVAVKDALNALGVDDAQIETISYGEEYANQECQADACGQDRRADITYEVE